MEGASKPTKTAWVKDVSQRQCCHHRFFKHNFNLCAIYPLGSALFIEKLSLTWAVELLFAPAEQNSLVSKNKRVTFWGTEGRKKLPINLWAPAERENRKGVSLISLLFMALHSAVFTIQLSRMLNMQKRALRCNANVSSKDILASLNVGNTSNHFSIQDIFF